MSKNDIEPYCEVLSFDKTKHFDDINNWWSLYFDGDSFPIDCVPENGVVVSHKNKIVASCFIYVNETKLAHMAFAIADYNLGPGRRCFFVKKAIEASIQKTKEIVGEDVVIYSLTDHAVVGRMYVESGFTCIGEGDMYMYSSDKNKIDFIR